MEFRILGVLEVEIAGRLVPLGEPQQQILLATLLVEAGRVVSVHRLVDAVWAQRPPATATKQVRNRVGILRRLLAAAGGGHEVIVTERAGYRINLDGAHVDALLFEQLVRQARAQREIGKFAEAAQRLRRALALWRGPFLHGLDSELLRGVAAAWETRRQTAMDDRLSLELALGRHREVLDELIELVAARPLSECLRGKLMVALNRTGRRAEALATYQDIRRRLGEELGVEPGPPLQRLHVQILRSDPVLDETRPELVLAQMAAAERDVSAGRVLPPREPPAQLPADVPSFTGRTGYLRQLDALLGSGPDGRPAAVVSAVSGTAGVGKTALAVHWAHRVADQFPDGQLYLNLRGYDPDGREVAPAEAVRGFLDALGVPPSQVPSTLDAQIGRYRSLLDGKRVLVVLDNARDADQVRTLLPGAGTARTVVTSRDRLTPLVATVGAEPVTVGLLSDHEARELLARRLDPGRTTAEPDAVERIIAACAHLPLALAIVAARARETGYPLAAIADELERSGSRLDALDAGDPASQVRRVFSCSYRSLGQPAARLFRLIGLHPGPDASVSALASLAGVRPPQTARVLTDLTRANLVTEHVAGRYACHDLLREYASELALVHDPAEVRHAAMARLLDHYLHTAHRAALLLQPSRDPITIGPARTGAVRTVLADAKQALAWFGHEYQALVHAIDLAAGSGFDAHAWQLPWALSGYLDRQGRWHDQERLLRTGLRAARRLGDRAGEAYGHRGLGCAHAQLGRHAQAQHHLTEALHRYAQLDDAYGRAYCHLNLDWLASLQDNYTEAIHHARQALTLFRALGDDAGQANALNALACNHLAAGDAQQAIANGQRALELHRASGEPGGQADAWDTIGCAHQQLHNTEQAITCFERALDLYREAGHRHRPAITLDHLGDTHHSAGDHDAARRTWRRALRMLDEIGHPAAERIKAKLDHVGDQPSMIS